MKNALLLGGFLGLLFSFLLLRLFLILDDAVYVPEDAQPVNRETKSRMQSVNARSFFIFDFLSGFSAEVCR